MNTSAANWCHVGKLDTPFQSLEPPIISRIFSTQLDSYALDPTVPFNSSSFVLHSSSSVIVASLVDRSTQLVNALDCFERSLVDLGDSSSKCGHAALVNNTVNGLLVIAEFASCSDTVTVVGAPFAHQMPLITDINWKLVT